MPRREEIHKDDIGTVLKLTVKDDTVVVDISTATTKQFVFEKPGGSTLTVTAEFDSDGVDGILVYTTVSGNLDEIGNWKVQARVVLPGSEFRSSIAPFRVFANL